MIEYLKLGHTVDGDEEVPDVIYEEWSLWHLN